MTSKKKEASASGERGKRYKRAGWKHLVKWFGTIVIVLLNVSLVISTLQGHMRGTSPPLATELFTFVVVLFFDVTALLPSILEVNEVWIEPDHLTIGNLVWKSKVPWPDVVSFEKPLWLAFAILKTRKCIYLINSRDIKPFDEFQESIEHMRRKSISA